MVTHRTKFRKKLVIPGRENLLYFFRKQKYNDCQSVPIIFISYTRSQYNSALYVCTPHRRGVLWPLYLHVFAFFVEKARTTVSRIMRVGAMAPCCDVSDMGACGVAGGTESARAL